MIRVAGAFLLILKLQGGILHAQEADLDLLTEYMTGSFTSTAQSQADTHFLDISLKMTQIWKDHPDVWLYVEQAETSTLAKPNRQQVYRLEQAGTDRFASHVYSLNKKEDWIGLSKKPKRSKEFSQQDLTELVGCSMGIVYQGGIFVGATQDLCQSRSGGASYASSEVTIKADTLVSWDRGWNDKGEQVWGATKGGYVFVKD